MVELYQSVTLYLKDYGDINLEERAALSASAKRDLTLFLPKDETQIVVEVANVDTHNIASHKSADESHVTAFKMMLEAHPELRINAKYKAPQKNIDPSREVEIVNRGNLDQFVADKTQELQRDVNNLLSMSGADIYNNYLRYNDIERFKRVEYKDLEADDKEAFDTKIKGLQFKAGTAKRYLDDMINNHKFKGQYEYRTDAAASSGLTMEQMVATSYWASKDQANFKNENVTEQGNFLSLVDQLYDMKRGYNIDREEDRPEELNFPANPKTDDHRCHGNS